LRLDSRAQHVARRDLGNTEFFGDERGLRSLASAGGAEQDQSHENLQRYVYKSVLLRQRNKFYIAVLCRGRFITDLRRCRVLAPGLRRYRHPPRGGCPRSTRQCCSRFPWPVTARGTRTFRAGLWAAGESISESRPDRRTGQYVAVREGWEQGVVVRRPVHREPTEWVRVRNTGR